MDSNPIFAIIETLKTGMRPSSNVIDSELLKEIENLELIKDKHYDFTLSIMKMAGKSRYFALSNTFFQTILDMSEKVALDELKETERERCITEFENWAVAQEKL